MGIIKTYESFNEYDKIHNICSKYHINNYTINDDGSIDVDDNVDLERKGLTELPLKFNKVTGNFNCRKNKLTSPLYGCPVSVGGHFSCGGNDITSFEEFPLDVSTYSFIENPVYNVWMLFYDYSKIELFNDFDPIRDNKVIILDRLNEFMDMIGRPRVKEVKGYTCI